MKLIDLFAVFFTALPITTALLLVFLPIEMLWFKLKLLNPMFRRKAIVSTHESPWCLVRAMAWHKGVLYLDLREEKGTRKRFLVTLAGDGVYIPRLWENRRNEMLCVRFKKDFVTDMDYPNAPWCNIDHLYYKLCA